MRFPNHYYLLLSDHYNGRYGGKYDWGVGLGDDLGEVRWKIVVDDVKGGGYYPKGVQLSPLNELSDELSCGLIGRVVVEICGDRRIWIVVAVEE